MNSNNAPTPERLTKGYLICLVGTILWSSTAVFIRFLTENYQIPALVLAFWRDFILFAALWLLFLFTARQRLRLKREHIPFILVYGLVLALFNSLWTVSVALNGAAISTVLVYGCSPAFTVILGARLFGDRLDPVRVGIVMVSIVGCIFVAGANDPAQWQVNPIGILTGLISGLGFAGYSLMGKAASHRDIPPWTTLMYTFGSAAIYLLAFNGIAGLFPGNAGLGNLFWLGDQTTGWLVLIALAVGPTAAGYGLYTVSLTYLSAGVANLIATLEPSMTAVLAYILLGERMTPVQLIGSAVAIGAVIALRIVEGREQPAVAENLAELAP